MSEIDNDRIPDEDELENDSEETGSEDSDQGNEQQSGVSLEQLATEVATLKSQNTKAMRDFNTAVGRLQALYAKIESGRGDTAAAITQLATQMKAVDGALEAVLEDEALDPKAREKALQARTKASSDNELAALKAKIEALETGTRPAQNTSSTPPNFEQSLVEEIESYGLDPDDATFDWKGEATQLLLNDGPAATQKYFRGKIRELLVAKEAAGRRQERKTAAGKKTTPDGSNSRELDPSLPVEERLKKLRAMGLIN